MAMLKAETTWGGVSVVDVSTFNAYPLFLSSQLLCILPLHMPTLKTGIDTVIPLFL